jgi:saccharopine dehydrogenase-like NADP-dependent oxidoreductase
MKKILILGAGLSSSSMIRYFLNKSEENNWQIRIVDRNLDLVKTKINGNKRGIALNFNVLDPEERKEEIEHADIVISMLPAKFHVEIAKDCIKYRTNLITPSYISEEMKALHYDAEEAGILIMNEIGVDPGIDHMSAAKIIDEVREKGGEIISFKSYCGGLVSPESDNNPWNYKFTWNPRNVVLAGQGGASKFIRNNLFKYIPYQALFTRLDKIEIEGFGNFEGYANRDSLSYRHIYGLDNIPTIFRGTLRREGFSEAWNIFVQLGMTDDSYTIEKSEKLTARNYINTFLPYSVEEDVETKFKRLWTPNNETLFKKFKWLGVFDDTEIIGFENATPAQLLEKILVNKLTLDASDKDMIVMYHEFEYELNSQLHKITSSMVNIGEDQVFTAMSNTVGLPVAICAKMVLNHEIKLTGIQLPVMKEVYNPILAELESYGITFNENWM